MCTALRGAVLSVGLCLAIFSNDTLQVQLAERMRAAYPGLGLKRGLQKAIVEGERPPIRTADSSSAAAKLIQRCWSKV